MADPFVAEIRIFGFNFAPTGWALCNGQILPISQNTALFSLLGTVYGGDGKSTFGLPNLQGSAPMFWGSGPGLTPREQGEQAGSETVTLIQSEMPLHPHTLMAVGAVGNRTTPAGNTLARVTGATPYQTSNTTSSLVPMSPQALGVAGGSLPHNNLMPSLALTFCIALQGVFPPRT